MKASPFAFLGMIPWLASCAEWTGDQGAVVIRDGALREASGVALSPANPDFLWMINDSGFPAQLHLIDRQGRARGTMKVDGAENRDWEELATWQHGGRSWLLIGDIGDNAAQRSQLTIYLLEEPELPEGEGKVAGKAMISRELIVTYPDGPRDCESMAVHGDDLYLLTKRDPVPRLYRMSLTGDGGVMTYLGEATRPEAPAGAPIRPFGNQPTSMDFSPDGKKAAVLTYRGVFLIERKPAQSWAEAFASPMKWLGPHQLFQAEAVAFVNGGQSVIVTTEGTNSPMISIPLPE